MVMTADERMLAAVRERIRELHAFAPDSIGDRLKFRVISCSGGRNVSRRLEKKGDLEGAIRHLREHLEEDPEDPDAWYALGELLCKAGRTKEGYDAFAEGRKYF